MSSSKVLNRLLRRAAVPVIASGLAFGMSVTLAGPAAASGSYSGRAYIYGPVAGTMTDDWTDEGVVNVATHRSSNVTCLWQTILMADGYLSASGVDGIFGDQTHAATVKWQRDRGLVADGSAGRDTWTKAGTKLTDNGSDSDGYRYGGYNGTKFWFAVRRSNSTGNWGFYEEGGILRSAAYNSRTCS
ncbi:peptidoglycan-binding domain-containing protein [Streptomyces fulvoviolaceus]|uniref:peptidoglycan-binding domain-containing protein n=1 Tax=Streptomyces fulvoviolaceus TaxID=285535 RepID=UPI000694000D|nr:peptidoglycan-binding domain-containing protein [Streptomyces fulvoviolaceus]MCT9076878.1 peptidoglycan-binding protein [Streptomyces fulvoviolaceus]